MSKTSPKADLELPDEQLDRAIEELRGVLKEEESRSEPEPDATGAGRASDSVIMNIPVEVQIVLGSAQMPVSELMALEKGSTVALNRRIGEPVDIVVNGRHIARGEITVLESDPSRFGVRLTEVITAGR